MSFDARETSRSLGAPIALFLFTYGPNIGNVYAYTTGEDPVTYNGDTYAPMPIYNQDFIASGTLDKATLEVSIAKDQPIVAMFTPWPPSTVVTLKIYIGHVGEDEFQVTWAGRVLSVRTGNDKGSDNQDDAILTCEPVSTSMRRSGLRRNWQFGCPHILYGPQCRAAPGPHVSPVVSSVESPFVELPTDWYDLIPDGFFVNGLATWTDSGGLVQVRSVIRITSPTEIQLDGDISTLEAGMTLGLSMGCDHQTTGCNLHDNIPNFGGQPWIPFVNPIGVTDNFT